MNHDAIFGTAITADTVTTIMPMPMMKIPDSSPPLMMLSQMASKNAVSIHITRNPIGIHSDIWIYLASHPARPPFHASGIDRATMNGPASRRMASRTQAYRISTTR